MLGTKKTPHLTTIKSIICYINGTLNYGLWYPYDFSLMIARYSNVYWVGNVENRKSIYSACFFVVDYLMAWLSKKQNSISLSISIAKYIIIESYCMQLLWMKQMLKDYGIEQGTMNIHCNNKYLKESCSSLPY